jgi:deoxyribose-phosphate aldolase
MDSEIFTFKRLPKIIDISALSAATKLEDVDKLAEAAKQYGFIAAFVMPCYTEYLARKLNGNSEVIIGAPIGFPTGADLSQSKIFQVKEMKKLGCTEFDMVIPIGMLKSGKLDYVKKDIAGVVEAADGYPVKVILEVTYLDDDEIKTGSEIVARSGAAYVKTGTGYSAKPSLVRHIKLMKETVGDSIKIKCAGGIKSLEQLKDMYAAGAERFGIGIKSALEIIESAKTEE